MKTIWKYQVELNDEFTLTLPQGAHILTIQTQHEIPYVWVLVDTEQPPEIRRFRLMGTGHPLNEPITRYIGTFQVDGGMLVFHLFEEATDG